MNDTPEDLKPCPKFTVLCNIVSEGSTWVGTSWEFFDDRTLADKRQGELAAQGHYPTCRPFHYDCDFKHLGAAHRNWGQLAKPGRPREKALEDVLRELLASFAIALEPYGVEIKKQGQEVIDKHRALLGIDEGETGG